MPDQLQSAAVLMAACCTLPPVPSGSLPNARSTTALLALHIYGSRIIQRFAQLEYQILSAQLMMIQESIRHLIVSESKEASKKPSKPVAVDSLAQLITKESVNDRWMSALKPITLRPILPSMTLLRNDGTLDTHLCRDLAVNPSGNHVISLIAEVANFLLKAGFRDPISEPVVSWLCDSPNLLNELSRNQYGCRMVQNLIEIACPEHRNRLIQGLLPNLRALSVHISGRHGP